MFELADRLVGIYKTDNATKTVTINPSHFVVGPTPASAQAAAEAADLGAGPQEGREELGATASVAVM
eukprot:360262-Chlamydomonas_euryale.AAC.16